MTEVQLPEVFTVDELARATGASREHLGALVASGQLRRVTGTPFIGADEAVRVGRALRRRVVAAPLAPAELFAAATASGSNRRPGMPAFLSSFAHASLLAVVILLSSMEVKTAVTEERIHEPARMVFIVSPGPGGGGGGGGLRNPLPAPKIERKAPMPRKALTVPAVVRPRPAPVVAQKPVQREPDPLPAKVLVAPVVATAADARDREGVIEKGRGDASSQGSGTGGGSGVGQGTGNGEGLGSGIGEGSGGGTGGGPYRPGSGIEPPRLLREVKAEYSDEARIRGISGEVVLEIVIRSDGTVGDTRVLRGLGAGLDQRAIQAVRQWRFSPAQRKGVPVDVLVEVAVDFILR